MADPVGQLPKAFLGRFASKLRFPQLFALTAGLFLLNLLIPDPIPFFDEILLGLLTLLLGTMGQKPAPEEPKPPMKDITPAKNGSSREE